MSFSEQVKRDTPSPKAFIAAINAITPSELTQEQQNLAQGFFTTLYQSGIQATRHYHNWDHYNDVAGDTPSPNRLIAALFHDCVQKNVDSGIEAATETALRHYYTEPEKVPDSITKAHIEEATSLEHLSAERRTLLTLIGTLFDSTEMKPPPNNANEFLSALYCAEAGSQLGIPKANILQQAALIVATVPFLSHDDFNHLEARLHAANSALPEAERLTDEQIVETMREATDMANQDVTNFAGDFETFKANSLKLLKESTRS